jgi:hypothetical protein
VITAAVRTGKIVLPVKGGKRIFSLDLAVFVWIFWELIDLGSPHVAS